jgi:acetyltransferase
MIGYCRARGTRKLIGQVMAENRPMLGLAESRGFQQRRGDDFETVDVALKLEG